MVEIATRLTLHERFCLNDDDRNLKKWVCLCEQMDLKWSLEVGKLESCWRIENHFDSYRLTEVYLGWNIWSYLRLVSHTRDER
jgi:hypothetical protein